MRADGPHGPAELEVGFRPTAPAALQTAFFALPLTQQRHFSFLHVVLDVEFFYVCGWTNK